MPQFIVYACPLGELADQLQIYFDKSRFLCRNTAHNYMPHCTLVGFYEDSEASIPRYVQALNQAYEQALRSQPSPPIAIQNLTFRPNWHGLELSSPWLQQLILDFVALPPCKTRVDILRPKDWLHLSLAYDFHPAYGSALAQLAQALLHPAALVEWELRYYQRDVNYHWVCHQTWPLGG